MSDILTPPTERECLGWARFHDEQAPRMEAKGHDREAADHRMWAESWRRSARVAAERDRPQGQPDPRQQTIFDALEAMTP